MNRSLAIFGGSTLIYAGLATLMGVLPGLWLSHIPPTPGLKPLTAQEARGRDIYVAEGCFYCHTQQVRPLSGDQIFGRPSAPGDFAYQTPELLGSERNGPDLSNIGVRQPSSVWQYIHLYEPRAVVPASIMPAFPWMFRIVDEAPPGEQPVPLPPAIAPAHGVVVPTEDGKALIAYLHSLKQPSLPGEKPAGAPVAGAPPPAVAGAPPSFNAAQGAKLFAANCAVCHGAEGKGVPGAFPPLAGDPVVNAPDPREQIATVLHGAKGRTIGGQTYSAEMPAFSGQLAAQQIADVIDHERTSWGNHGTVITAADVITVQANQPALQGPAAMVVGPGPSGSGAAPAAAPVQPTRPQAKMAEQAHPPGKAVPPTTFNAAEGAKLFAGTCALCHGAEGKGVPGAFPPLAGNPVVNSADPAEHIRVVLHGLKGKTIEGTAYPSEMPGFAAQFTDQQIADIIDHERTSWGNHGKLITPQDVGVQRANKK